MKNPFGWSMDSSPGARAEALEATTHAEVNKPLGLIGTLGLTLVALCVSALISGAMVLAISRFGAGTGLPVLGFKGALALALLGSWFSMGSTGVRETPLRDFPDFLANTLIHQVCSALLMLILLGVLSLLLGRAT